MLRFHSQDMKALDCLTCKNSLQLSSIGPPLLEFVLYQSQFNLSFMTHLAKKQCTYFFFISKHVTRLMCETKCVHTLGLEQNVFANLKHTKIFQN